MSGYQLVTGGHLGDAVLMQLLDREPGTPTEAHAHLRVCDACRARLNGLREAGALLRDALPEVTMPRLSLSRARLPRRAWVTSIPIAAAASLVVLASAAAATPPVRAWILRHITPPETPVPIKTAPAKLPAASSMSNAGIIASFAPSDTALVIRFDQRQARGALVLTVTGSDRISAQAVGGATAEEMIVLPGQLRVINTGRSVADYRVTVPVSVRRVRVLVGDTEIVALRTASGLERRIDLR